MAFESSSDAARKSPPCALVIFGASGDLTQRKLIPAIERLARRPAAAASSPWSGSPARR